MTTEKGLWAGLLLDAVVGDPRRGHPVAAFGRAASALERRLYADSRARGAVFTGICVLGAAGLGIAADAVVRSSAARTGRTGRRPRRVDPERAGGRARVVVTAVSTWAVLGGTSLGREGLAMAAALEAGDVEAARRRLPHLCGRDPSALDAKELARATVESIAENTSDAAVAPLFWGSVFGVPGLLAYRAVNTLDAMVGHRSPRYLRFGWAAARLDDVANWAPARLTGLLTVVCAPLVGGSPRAAYAILRRDGAAHPSPNAGRCEAAFAGALGVRLGGVNVYGNRVEHRPELGDGRAAEPHDIRRAVRLSQVVTVASAVVTVGARAAVRAGWRSLRR
ncbi:cobalamin biosynthesis protein [Actinoallomurus acanthiterrae]